MQDVRCLEVQRFHIITSGWGADAITIGLLAYVASTNVMKYGGLAWVFVLGLLLSTVDLIYFWATGAYTARTVLVPVVIQVVLAVWIWTSRGKVTATEGGIGTH
jgi:hypothetical protein